MSADDVVQKISFVGIRICKSGSGFQSHPMAVEDFSSETRRPKTTNCVMIRLGHVQLGGPLSMRPTASGYDPVYRYAAVADNCPCEHSEDYVPFQGNRELSNGKFLAARVMRPAVYMIECSFSLGHYSHAQACLKAPTGRLTHRPHGARFQDVLLACQTPSQRRTASPLPAHPRYQRQCLLGTPQSFAH